MYYMMKFNLRKTSRILKANDWTKHCGYLSGVPEGREEEEGASCHNNSGNRTWRGTVAQPSARTIFRNQSDQKACPLRVHPLRGVVQW